MGLDRRRLLAAGLFLTLGGCAGRGGVTLVSGGRNAPGELETLSALQADASGLTVTVASTGCTRRDDFTFYVDRSAAQPTVAFARKRLDVCRQATTTAVLRFSYQELGVPGRGRLAVLNPVGVAR
ncbi:hypothetical protein [Caulobacter sp. BK020]|uniref:hypothetical protein n=1 Tax=Caulobacter sp. BK020 TaxID=2512117 RepID=UPI00104A597B|nr:hypothetical protein [Caulobacter sp. BK020]TCS16059.1 hypothetical protein EV278_104233 [Caulobacter sp. BK020]